MRSSAPSIARSPRRYHPDLNSSPDPGRRMAEVNEAYAVLSDPGRRAAYDAELAKRRDRRAGDWLIRPGSVPAGAAGQPVGAGQIRRHDQQFLEWLMSVPGGRQSRQEMSSLLRGQPTGGGSPLQAAAR